MKDREVTAETLVDETGWYSREKNFYLLAKRALEVDDTNQSPFFVYFQSDRSLLHGDVLSAIFSNTLW
jgi:hypothetical protein